jgi:hypothetical protein
VRTSSQRFPENRFAFHLGCSRFWIANESTDTVGRARRAAGSATIVFGPSLSVFSIRPVPPTSALHLFTVSPRASSPFPFDSSSLSSGFCERLSNLYGLIEFLQSKNVGGYGSILAMSISYEQ